MRNYQCDRCGNIEILAGLGNVRPVGWSSVRINQRVSLTTTEQAYVEALFALCKGCTDSMMRKWFTGHGFDG